MPSASIVSAAIMHISASAAGDEARTSVIEHQGAFEGGAGGGFTLCEGGGVVRASSGGAASGSPPKVCPAPHE
mgnify:CR=1 FL=1